MKYSLAFEIAEIAIRERQAHERERFMPGAARAAALAAVLEQRKPLPKRDIVGAIAGELMRFTERSPRWDGSIA